MRHGLARYKHLKCRCDICRKANAEHGKRWRQERQELIDILREDGIIGFCVACDKERPIYKPDDLMDYDPICEPCYWQNESARNHRA